MYEALISHLRECAKIDPAENTFSEAANAIEELSAQIPHWIPVTERLPEYGRSVLLYFNRNNHNSMGVGDYYHDGDTLIWRGCGFIPTHWMPLPEPPDGGADNG